MSTFPERTVREITVSQLNQSGFCCPMRWVGVLEDGRDIIFRYRNGWWSIYTGEVSIFSQNREVVAEGPSGQGEGHGICDWSEFQGWALEEGFVIRVLSWNYDDEES